MNGEIIEAALNGAKVTVESDCWPLHRKAGGIVIHMMKQTYFNPRAPRGARQQKNTKQKSVLCDKHRIL